MPQQSTVGAALAAITHLLEESGIESPRRTAELLLCHVLGLSRLDLVLRRNEPLPAPAWRRLRALLRRRLQHEPLQYLLGEVEFYGLRLKIRRGVFIPRPETELLVEEALARIEPRAPVRVLDIGTGSGCIALAIAAHRPTAEVVGVDISARALRLARSNARRLQLANVRFFLRDILRQLPPRAPFQLVVSNPPYISAALLPQLQPEVRCFEPPEALTDGADGLSFYRHFARLFPRILLPGGSFLLELPEGAAHTIATLFEPIASALQLRKDYAGTERILVGTLRYGSSSLPPAVP